MVSLSQQQQRTVGFLKPDVVDLKTELMDLIKSNHQWKVTFEQELILSLGEAKVLYPQDNEALWLSSHPIYVFVLEGNNVVQHWLDYVGPKDPEEAKQVSPQSLRACYGLDSFYNVLLWMTFPFNPIQPPPPLL
ncbi:nucleoside diphosphate kinase [Chlamydoabsidia padenii]|nr:nucleoside diphosphate kinase [Chlamydoabsidia padenii]